MKIELDLKMQNLKSRTACSEEVRDFYERLPYPAPLTSLDEHLQHYRNPERRRALFHLMWPTERPRDNQEILIAGCGTSQAARYALREPNAQITAIDISETCLHHTRKLQQKYELGNLELHLLSILDVHSLGKVSIKSSAPEYYITLPIRTLLCNPSVMSSSPKGQCR